VGTLGVEIKAELSLRGLRHDEPERDAASPRVRVVTCCAHPRQVDSMVGEGVVTKQKRAESAVSVHVADAARQWIDVKCVVILIECERDRSV
jgi:hypothetical protein